MARAAALLALVVFVFVTPEAGAGESGIGGSGATAGQEAGPAGGARPVDPLSNLKSYEQRRYRMDMEDCGKQKGVDRRVCERVVRRQALDKSRRRAEGLP